MEQRAPWALVELDRQDKVGLAVHFGMSKAGPAVQRQDVRQLGQKWYSSAYSCSPEHPVPSNPAIRCPATQSLVPYNPASCLRLATALLKEWHEDWITGRRYLRMDRPTQLERTEEELEPAA